MGHNRPENKKVGESEMNLIDIKQSKFKPMIIIKIFIIMLLPYYFLFASVSFNEGVKLIKNKQYKKAINLFEEIVKNDEKNDSALYYIGYSWVIQNDHDKAIDYLEKAIEIDNKNAKYHFWLGQAFGQKAQNSNPFKQAWIAPKILKEFEKTVELDPEFVDGYIGLCNFYLQAPSIVGGDVKKAKVKAKTVVDLDEFQGRIILAAIYNKEKQIDSARIQYGIAEKSFIDSTHHYGFFNAYGYFLLNLKEFDKAIEKFNKQVQLAPDVANTHDSLGDGYKAAGKLELALQEYKIAIDLDPNFKASQKNYKDLCKKMKK